MTRETVPPASGARSGPRRRWWWWLLALVPMAAGLLRLQLNVEVLDLLPSDVPAVAGLKLHQRHFASGRELIVLVEAPTAEAAREAARAVADGLRKKTNLTASVTWQPPWTEHPEQTAELIAYLWFNQPPAEFARLAARLSGTNLPSVLDATREELATTLSPKEIARLGYDPFGLSRLPGDLEAFEPALAGKEMFASADGRFRLLFVEAKGQLDGYRECTAWLGEVREAAEAIARTQAKTQPAVRLSYTGRPAFVAEISGSMKQEMMLSVGGTALIIAALFWAAHRRWKPMLWLLTLLVVILASTLALGGLIFGVVNVVSMGFAAILLGLAVDYAVVHYQEAMAHPDWSIPEVRAAIAPSILWAAVTTIAAFLVLNFGGLPGLGQLGTLVAVGIALSALVMIFFFLPPLFPGRRHRNAAPAVIPVGARRALRVRPFAFPAALFVSAGVIVACAGLLSFGLPKLDGTARALQPRNSQAYAALQTIQDRLGQREPLWLLCRGKDESEVARRLKAIEPIVEQALSNGLLSAVVLPLPLWPQPPFQMANREPALRLVANQPVMREAALARGFTLEALGLMESMMQTWQKAGASPKVYWPENPLCAWILKNLASRGPDGFLAAGYLFPPERRGVHPDFTRLSSDLAAHGVLLSSWELLGGTVLSVVQRNLWKLVVPMLALVLVSLWMAFKRSSEILLSLLVLLFSGLILLAVMRLLGWSWNLLNLMAVPLILGTGVDYSIFMQLALRRHDGDFSEAHRSVGRALLLCGGAALAGFGSLGLSSNEGMASLGRVCAVGVAANMLAAVFLLPAWWRRLCYIGPDTGRVQRVGAAPSLWPSRLYGASIWRAGLRFARWIPRPIGEALAAGGAALYWRLARSRREVVIDNLLPVLGGRSEAVQAARELYGLFALKVFDLWRYESGEPAHERFSHWHGWEALEAARARGRGVLLVTPHLGNWELGGEFLARRGCDLLVLTQPEPDPQLTKLRQASRARWGVKTLVVGHDPFAFVDIIKRLEEGLVVALLVDRPPPPTAVIVELFGKPFSASNAAAELARASGCAVVPSYIVSEHGRYVAEILPEITYDRVAIGDRPARIAMTQRIITALEPAIRRHASQWYHFVPAWPESSSTGNNPKHHAD